MFTTTGSGAGVGAGEAATVFALEADFVALEAALVALAGAEAVISHLLVRELQSLVPMPPPGAARAHGRARFARRC